MSAKEIFFQPKHEVFGVCSEKGELPNSPVDCLVRGKALARERFPYYERHLLQPSLAAAGVKTAFIVYTPQTPKN